MVKRSMCLTVVLCAGLGCSEDADIARTADTGTDYVVNETGVDTGTSETAPADSGSEKDCLESPNSDAFFTLDDINKCIVARYDAPVGSVGVLTWGRHGGPLGFSGGTKPALVRYEVPTGATGTLTVKRTELVVDAVPADAFWGGFALDLPFNNFTAFAYTGMGTGFPGELILTNGAALTRYHANGFFAPTFVSTGRLLHTGLGPLTTTRSTNNAGALYAEDTCGTAKLLPDGEPACKDAQKISSWQAGASGPVASDPNDNVFAILSKFGGSQELRGFEHSTIAKGQGPVAGDTMFTDTQYTSDLVADGKSVYWQPNDATTFSALDPLSLAYTVDAASRKILPIGSPGRLLKLKTPGTNVSLMRDSSRRIWIAVAAPATGDAGATSSVLFVIRAKKP